MNRLFFILLITLTSATVACRKVGPKMPTFSFETLFDKPFTKKDIDASHANILVFFYPTCDHCQKEARDLVAHRKDLGAAKVYFISKAPKDELVKFDADYHLSDNGFEVLSDTQGKAKAWFGVSDVPTVFVYDTYNELVVQYVNEVAATQLAKDVQ